MPLTDMVVVPEPVGADNILSVHASVLEIRPLYEVEDFGEALTPELRDQEDRLRKELDDRT